MKQESLGISALEIRAARRDEGGAVRAFYHSLIDRMIDEAGFPGWEKGVHPSDELLFGSVERGEMLLGLLGGRIVAGMVLNHEVGQGYDEARWLVSAPCEQVTVLHVLAVDPDLRGRGLAGQMVDYAIEYCQDRDQRSLRLDVMEGNGGAERVYERAGFVCAHRRRSVYGWAGEITARLMEKVL